MTGRALRLLVTNIRTRPTVAATVPRLVWLEPYSSSLATRNTFGTSSWLQNSLSDEEEVILLVGTTNNQSRMRWMCIKCGYCAVSNWTDQVQGAFGEGWRQELGEGEDHEDHREYASLQNHVWCWSGGEHVDQFVTLISGFNPIYRLQPESSARQQGRKGAERFLVTGF